MRDTTKQEGAEFSMRDLFRQADLDDIMWNDFDNSPDTGIFYTIANNGLPYRISMPVDSDMLEDLKKMLQSQFLIPDENTIVNKTLLKDRSEYKSLFLFAAPDLYFELTEYSAEIYMHHDRYRNTINGVIDKINRIRKNHVRLTDNFYLIISEDKELKIRRFRLKPFSISLEDNYNDDILPVHETICRSFSEKQGRGIVLLHGEPGTGKTTYIRYLARTIGKKIIYIPPQFSVNLTSSSFINLLIQHPDSILIIEDAENIIQDRNTGRNFSISSLLNISDGLLSYCLNLRVICTFNTDLSRIDPALMRKGRLTALYEFRKLSIEKSIALAEKTGYMYGITRPLTLAELYNPANDDANYKNGRKIGFNS